MSGHIVDLGQEASAAVFDCSSCKCDQSGENMTEWHSY
jgi:hypothetical protein